MLITIADSGNDGDRRREASHYDSVIENLMLLILFSRTYLFIFYLIFLEAILVAWLPLIVKK